jgi:soluble lytic murein transglycosylase-like protein
MSTRQPYPSSRQTAAFEQEGGCLSGFVLPPLAVICVSVVLIFIWLGTAPASTPSALAAESEQTTPFVQTNLLVSATNMAPLTQEITPPPDPIIAQAALANTPAQVSGNPISSIFRPEIQYWSGAIQVWAAAAGLDPNLVATVMQIESCGDPRAHSRAGAIGLFQVMPDHFNGSEDPYLPNTNAERGLAYLDRSLKAANGDVRLALAGYNGGISVIGYPGLSWPGENQRYVYWGTGIYAEASNGATESIRLQEWMAAGGTSLCRQARYRLGINP